MNEKELLSSLFDELFPIMRSITGEGIEKSFDIIGKHMPLKMTKVSSGSKIFDWTVPKEWVFKKATLIDPLGNVICDANINNLHVVNYSEPINKKVSFEELQKHLHSIPELPEAIPYVTSYYNRTWGFCLSHRERKKLIPGTYEVFVDSDFIDGGVPYSESFILGESKKEILLTSYLCHPSLANNELSGPLVLLGLFLRINQWEKRRFSYRFLLNPETIGTLCFLSKNLESLKDNLESGLILTCLGGPNNSLNYKKSRSGSSLIDKVFESKMINFEERVVSQSFTPTNGSDERQYGAPGINLPIGQVSRTTYGNYEEYHNSLDTKEFMDMNQIIKSIDTIEQILLYAEVSGKPINLAPFGEPQLGKRGLYPSLNTNNTRSFSSSDSNNNSRDELERLLILLNLSDGDHDLMQISQIANCSLDEMILLVKKLEKHKLIKYNIKTPNL